MKSNTKKQENFFQGTTWIKEYGQYLLDSILKPFDTFEKNLKKLGEMKNSLISAGIVVVILTIINLIKAIFSAIRVTSYSWTTGKATTTWVWENVKNVALFKTIGQSILIYAVILLAISGVYYLASLVIKKNTKFENLLYATTTAFVPFVGISFIVAPIISLISSTVGICATAIGSIYFIITLIEYMNTLIDIDNKNVRIYFHIICLSILLIVGGLITYKIVLDTVSSSLGSLSSLLK